MTVRNIVLAALVGAATVAAGGCADEPVPHHAVEQKVANVESGVDITAREVERNFGSLEKKAKEGDVWVIRSKPEIREEMGKRERRYCKAVITPLSETAVQVDVSVISQKDESDTGYGENSPSNPKWGVEVHDQELERKILEEIKYALDKAAEQL